MAPSTNSRLEAIDVIDDDFARVALHILKLTEQGVIISDFYAVTSPEYAKKQELHETLKDVAIRKLISQNRVTGDGSAEAVVLADVVAKLLSMGAIRPWKYELMGHQFTLTEDGEKLLKRLSEQSNASLPQDGLDDVVRTYWSEARELCLVSPRASALLLGVAFEHFVELVDERLNPEQDQGRGPGLKARIDKIRERLEAGGQEVPGEVRHRAREAWECIAPVQRWVRNQVVHEPETDITAALVTSLVLAFPRLCGDVLAWAQALSPAEPPAPALPG
jgi:hypothetical protein